MACKATDITEAQLSDRPKISNEEKIAVAKWQDFIQDNSEKVVLRPDVSMFPSILRGVTIDQRHCQPGSGVGCTPDHRGISLGWGLYDPGPRSLFDRSQASSTRPAITSRA
jgi:hypothetical protein